MKILTINQSGIQLDKVKPTHANSASVSKPGIQENYYKPRIHGNYWKPGIQELLETKDTWKPLETMEIGTTGNQG